MTATIELPAELTANIQNRWPTQGTAWAQDVMRQFFRLCARYEAEPLHLMPARFGLVVAVASPRGPLIMKSTPDPAGPVQAAFARRFADLGMAPTMHELVTTSTGTWTVMDRVLPGNTLETVTPSAELKDHLIGTLRSLVNQPAPTDDAPTIADWLRSRLVNPDPNDLAPDQAPASERDRRQALGVLDSLHDNATAGLCHGDAHPGNILVDAESRLWWIDPRGMRGEAAYDVAVLALKVARTVDANPHDLAVQLGNTIGVDAERAGKYVTIADAART